MYQSEGADFDFFRPDDGILDDTAADVFASEIRIA